MNIRILIADDHELIRRGLADLIKFRPSWEVCAQASDGAEAVKLASTAKPDVAILDLTMPNTDGLTAARKIRAADPHVEVLILTHHHSEQLVTEVLRAGARGYLLKDDAGADLLDAIDAVAHHKPYFTKEIAQGLVDAYVKSLSGSHGDLSDREREVVQLLAEGRSNKEVASALKLSVATVETHRANIMQKLGIHSLADLVRYAVRNHIVEP